LPINIYKGKEITVENQSKKTETQVRLWKYAAWTLPFVALAAIVFSSFIGIETMFDKTIVIISSSFFAIAVFWWWWALHKLLDIVKVLDATARSLQWVKNSIGSIRKDLQDHDSDR
jgi:hypothetical protein